MIGKLRLLFWIGIVVCFLPYIGIPTWSKTALTALLGVGIIITSYRLKRVYKELKFKLREHTEHETPAVIASTNE